VFGLYDSALENRDPPPETLADWIGRFGVVIRNLPPYLGRAVVGADQLPARASFSVLDARVLSVAAWRAGWDALFGFVQRYLAGDSIADLARTAFDIEGEVSTARSDGRKPLPKTIGLVDRMGYNLSMVAGGLVAMYVTAEESGDAEGWNLSEASRSALELLPLALRNGCGTQDSLSWFRFGLRHRRVAHLLATVFPVPADRTTEDEIEAWIGTTRMRWVEGGIEPGVLDDDNESVREVLEAGRVVLAGELLGEG
jgi:hypothetical protein